jgi:hypothetical protein
MPFNHASHEAFTELSIRENAPASSGVYGLTNSAGWIYIGECDDIRKALLDHLQEPDTPVVRRRPTGFVFEVCNWRNRVARHDSLIVEYEPRCNRHWPLRG